mmetsp:Transcript_10041/g.11525  ORF Transcript_10041/g.11525 Transcript_10041/m.11525 type:complete len:537 (-) Transcript_10041:215-1825(-)
MADEKNATPVEAEGKPEATNGNETKKEESKTEKLEYVARPDKAEKEAKLSEIESKIAELVKTRTKQEANLKEIRDKNQPERAVLEKLKNEIKELSDKKNAALKERDLLRSQLDKIRQKQKSKREELRKFRSSLKYSKVEEVDAEIGRLEQYQNTVSLSLKEEKDLIKKISGLRQERKKVEELKRLAGGATAEGSNMDEKQLSELVKTKNAELSELFDELNKKRDERKAITTKREKDGDKLNKVYNQVSKTREKVNDLYAKKRAILAEWKQKNDEYYTYQRALQAERKRIEQERFEEEKKRREEEAKKRAEEEMKKKPWTEEIALCDFLVNYLEKLLPSDKEKKASGSANSAESGAGDVHKGFEDLKLVQKKKDIHDDFMVMGAAKAKKSKKKNKKKETRLTHSVDLLGSFELLSLEAPTKVTEIPSAIDALKEKRAYYDVLPRAPKKNEDAEGKKKGKSKKTTAAPSVESSDLFPIIPGSKSPKALPTIPVNGPTAVDMVKSNGGLNSGSFSAVESLPTPAESMPVQVESPVLHEN